MPKKVTDKVESGLGHIDDYGEVISKTLDSLKRGLISKEDKLDIWDMLYEAMYMQYEYLEHRIDKNERCQRMCKSIVEDILPLLESELSVVSKDSNCNPEDLSKWYKDYEKFYALASRDSFMHYILFLEWDKSKKTWQKRVDTLAPLIYYLNKISYDDKLKLIRCSIFPGAGKSYLTSMFEAWSYGRNWDETIIRLSYSDSLVCAFSSAVRVILRSERHCMVFPQFERNKDELFSKETDNDWKLKGASLNASHIAEPRNGQVTGKRGNIVIIDDIVKDSKEAQSKELHDEIWNKYTTDWTSRALDGTQKTILVGTMWSPVDLLNRVEEFESSYQDIVDDPKFKYTRISKDGSSVFINIPALDVDTDESTMEEVYSTKYFKKQREAVGEYYWACVYQQDPIPAEGLEFDDKNLRHYSAIPKDADGNFLTNKVCMASLDPARKGKDNVSMPIFNKIGDDYYLLDVIFEKRAMNQLYDDIVNSIIRYNITNLVLESNTDTSLSYLLKNKLKERGYFSCDIIEKYNTEKKESRIMDMKGTIKNCIVFPSKERYTKNSPIGRFMENLNAFSFDTPNKHDDAPDSVAMFCKEYVSRGVSTIGSITPFPRIF